jgi:hypothetical protein
MADSLKTDGWDKDGEISEKAFAPVAEDRFRGEEGTTSCVNREMNQEPVQERMLAYITIEVKEVVIPARRTLFGRGG